MACESASFKPQDRIASIACAIKIATLMAMRKVSSQVITFASRTELNAVIGAQSKTLAGNLNADLWLRISGNGYVRCRPYRNARKRRITTINAASESK